MLSRSRERKDARMPIFPSKPHGGCPKERTLISERLLSTVVKTLSNRHLELESVDVDHLPEAEQGRPYLLYMHVPFCQRLCPYCSFNRYAFQEDVAKRYFVSLRKEMLMLKDLGYDFESIYIGGGTPTIMIDELCETIDLARSEFSVKEVSSETNPNHLGVEYLEKMKGRIQRLSVGVQSFDDGLLKQMDRYEKYGSGEEIIERIAQASPYFDSLNVDMIYNFPSQTEEILRRDLERVIESGCTQTTFSPLYVSSATSRKIASTLGSVGHGREFRYYQIIEEMLTEGDDPAFENRTTWTYSRRNHIEHAQQSLLIDEYSSAHEEYPAIGSGSVTNLGGSIYVNTFSLSEYSERIDSGRMSVTSRCKVDSKDLMRYRFMLQLHSLRLDKKQFESDFGRSVDSALPMEMAFLRANKAFATDDENELTLTQKGRYLTTVMYRQFLSGMSDVRDQARKALPGPERILLFGDGTVS